MGRAAPAAPAGPAAAPKAPPAPPEPIWLAGKRGLLIGFVAGMILTAAAMFLVMRLL
jgi:serine/threonine-protein kinase